MISDSNINQRDKKVLEAIIEDYILFGQPVSSRKIAKNYVALSPATVRNIMGDLETLGLITHPHISAGRLPTAQGYRYYIDQILHVK
jgi:heat-inducible transcriptional repressor